MRFLQRILWRTLEWPIALLWFSFLSLIRATSHVEDDVPAGPAVFVNWHRYQSFLIGFHGAHHRWMLVSRAPQLAPVARFCRLTGLRLVRGASGDRGKEALEELKDLIRRGESVVIAVDGPRGPLFRAKKGCADLARATGVPIVPVAFRASRSHEFLWRWDRTLVPLPFARIRVAAGAPVTAVDDEQQTLAAVETELGRLEERMSSR